MHLDIYFLIYLFIYSQKEIKDHGLHIIIACEGLAPLCTHNLLQSQWFIFTSKSLTSYHESIFCEFRQKLWPSSSFERPAFNLDNSAD